MERSVYLPAGVWYDFNTNERMEGGRKYTIRPTGVQLPIFVKAGTILPLAEPLENIPEGYQFAVTCYVYGDGDTKGELFEDDGYTFAYEHGAYAAVMLNWKNGRGVVTRSGAYKKERYRVVGWRVVK